VVFKDVHRFTDKDQEFQFSGGNLDLVVQNENGMQVLR
jgi:hypothetical protein